MATIESSYDYIIVGAGMAGAKAIEGIRSADSDGKIAVFGAEAAPPVYRPDLSKTLWLDDDASLEKSELTDDDTAAAIFTDTAVESIAPDEHRVALAGGRQTTYGKLLIATGSEPRTIALDAGPRVIYYRTVADYEALRKVAGKGSHVLVVGGGYIGTELASALTQNDVKVTMVVDGDTVQANMFPADLAKHITSSLTDQGVKLVHGKLAGGEATDNGVTVTLEDGQTLDADAAVLGLGVTPRTELAQEAGIEVDNGIVVDDHLRTSADDVYAAGDVISYPDARLGRRRVEHADQADASGETAGKIMAGADTTYTHTPFFWSDIFDAGYEAIGELSASHELVEDWKDDEFSSGVVYYVRQGSVRGVLLWNTWDSVPKAQDLIESTATKPVSDPESLKGTIPLG